MATTTKSTTVINVHEAKTHLSKLIKRAEAGEHIVIARAGSPVAVLGPIINPAQRVFGIDKKYGTVIGDDWDDPLPEFEEYV